MHWPGSTSRCGARTGAAILGTILVGPLIGVIGMGLVSVVVPLLGLPVWLLPYAYALIVVVLVWLVLGGVWRYVVLRCTTYRFVCQSDGGRLSVHSRGVQPSAELPGAHAGARRDARSAR